MEPPASWKEIGLFRTPFPRRISCRAILLSTCKPSSLYAVEQSEIGLLNPRLAIGGEWSPPNPHPIRATIIRSLLEEFLCYYFCKG
jgi:hypothetical protein